MVVTPVALGAIYIRRSIGEETFDIGPGMNIWMAAELGSTVAVGVLGKALGKVGSSKGVDLVSVGIETGSGVDDGRRVTLGVGDEGSTVEVAFGTTRMSGVGDACFVNSWVGTNFPGGTPQPDKAAPISTRKTRIVRRPIIIFPPAGFGLRAVNV
jgi:hypothetical protein